MADGVYVSIGGDSKKLQEASSDAVKALRELAQQLDDVGKKAAGESGTSSSSGGAKGLNQYRFSLDSLKGSLLENMGQFGAFMVVLNSAFGVIGEVVSVVGGAVDSFLQLAGTIGGAVVDAVRMASQELEQLTQQVFDLNKSTEQNTGSWQFIYGGASNVRDLMQWTSKFSMDVPYTRQDLMGAVTALGRAGLSSQDVESYMSTIADMGALNPQRNLTQAAWSVQGAMHGYSRMLKYDYGIDPGELEKFGYDKSAPDSTLLPALKDYLSSRGMSGASKYAATNTFWGAESSFVDRLQNFGLQVGGTSLGGDIGKNSMFGILKTDLTDISTWWDDHGKDIAKLADLFGNVLGGAAREATRAIKELADGLKNSGVYDWFVSLLGGATGTATVPAASTYSDPIQTRRQAIMDRLGIHQRTGLSWNPAEAINAYSDPTTSQHQAIMDRLSGHRQTSSPSTPATAPAQQQQLSFWRELGQLIGAITKDVGEFGQSLVKAFMSSGAKESVINAMQIAVKWLTNPQVQQQIKALGAAIGDGLGKAISLVVDGAILLAAWWHTLTSQLDPDAWLAIKIAALAVLTILATIGIVIATAVLVPFILLAGIIAIVAGVVWLLIKAFEGLSWLADKINVWLVKAQLTIMTWFQTLKNDFKTWAGDLILNFIAGLEDKFPQFKGFLERFGNMIRDWLGHSKPKVGPLADDDQWMGHFMDNLIAPLNAGVPRIAAATRQIATAMSNEFAGGMGGSGGSSSYATNTYGGHSSISQTFHGTSETQMERVAKRVMGEADAAQNIFSRRVGGYRPGLFGSIG